MAQRRLSPKEAFLAAAAKRQSQSPKLPPPSVEKPVTPGKETVAGKRVNVSVSDSRKTEPIAPATTGALFPDPLEVTQRIDASDILPDEGAPVQTEPPLSRIPSVESAPPPTPGERAVHSRDTIPDEPTHVDSPPPVAKVPSYAGDPPGFGRDTLQLLGLTQKTPDGPTPIPILFVDVPRSDVIKLWECNNDPLLRGIQLQRFSGDKYYIPNDTPGVKVGGTPLSSYPVNSYTEVPSNGFLVERDGFSLRVQMVFKDIPSSASINYSKVSWKPVIFSDSEKYASIASDILDKLPPAQLKDGQYKSHFIYFRLFHEGTVVSNGLKPNMTNTVIIVAHANIIVRVNPDKYQSSDSPDTTQTSTYIYRTGMERLSQLLLKHGDRVEIYFIDRNVSRYYEIQVQNVPVADPKPVAQPQLVPPTQVQSPARAPPAPVTLPFPKPARTPEPARVEPPARAQPPMPPPAHVQPTPIQSVVVPLTQAKPKPVSPPAAKQTESQTTVVFTITDDRGTRIETLTSDVIKIGSLNMMSHLYIHDLGVSKLHAVIEVDSPNEIRIIDLGSSAGTFVNGTQVNKAEIKQGDVIQVGDARIVVSSISSSRAPSVPVQPRAPLPMPPPVQKPAQAPPRASAPVVSKKGVQHKINLIKKQKKPKGSYAKILLSSPLILAGLAGLGLIYLHFSGPRPRDTTVIQRTSSIISLDAGVKTPDLRARPMPDSLRLPDQRIPDSSRPDARHREPRKKRDASALPVDTSAFENCFSQRMRSAMISLNQGPCQGATFTGTVHSNGRGLQTTVHSNTDNCETAVKSKVGGIATSCEGAGPSKGVRLTITSSK